MTVSTVPFVTRIIAGYQQDDALAISSAIDDAAAAGYNTRQLLVVLAGAIAGLLADQGFDVEHDSQELLRAMAEAELDGLCE